MKNFSTDLPAMYGDHHVREVRRLLSELPGIKDIYASSAFQILQVEYDEGQLKEDQIISTLDSAGYLGDFLTPEETSLPATDTSEKKIFRHTAAFDQTRKVSFHRTTAYAGRPLWPCPGMGPVTKDKVEG
jgi:copper chaperone CopZ